MGLVQFHKSLDGVAFSPSGRPLGSHEGRSLLATLRPNLRALIRDHAANSTLPSHRSSVAWDLPSETEQRVTMGALEQAQPYSGSMLTKVDLKSDPSHRS